MALLGGKSIDAGDLILSAPITIPPILFWLAYGRQNFAPAIVALGLDLIGLGLQIQSWWLPYIFGTEKEWQLAYAKGPTKKILPSFGHHVAPDGMHFLISVLLTAALGLGVAGVGELRGVRRAPARDGSSAI
jgi:hypothetical protein